jgi:hypothetical protein
LALILIVRDQSIIMTYTVAEKEVIGLCIALEAVGDMVNHALLELRDVSSYPGEVEVYFHTHIHQELFIIRLLDFVKESVDSKLTGVSGSCITVLQSACSTCSFNKDDSVELLRRSVKELDDWLKTTRKMKLWLPTLDVEADIEVSRLDFIKISGNHFKHNLSRLTGVSKHISTILEKNGYSVPLEQIPLALDDFREHLQENYFIYYGTWLTELLNNVRWGLQLYLLPIFMASYAKDDPDDIRYHYEYPKEIKNDIPKQWFWRLMNNVRSQPYIKQFFGAHYLKKESSLESDENEQNP